jgi:hypothetical protein
LNSPGGEMTSTALARIPVGVVVERHKATSPWLDFLCRPVSVLAGVPAAAPWTVISSEGDVTTLYAGEAVIELYRTETANYRDNLASGPRYCGWSCDRRTERWDSTCSWSRRIRRRVRR